MRFLLIVIGIIIGIYSGWQKHNERQKYPVGICQNEFTPEQVSEWARQAAEKAVVLQKDVPFEATSDRSLFTKQGWRSINDALQAAGIADMADSFSLQVTESPSSQLSASGSWQTSLPVEMIYVREGSRNVRSAVMHMRLSCEKRADASVVLQIGQIIIGDK